MGAEVIERDVCEDLETLGFDPDAPHRVDQATGKAGSVLLFDNRLWHAAGPNRSQRNRVGMVMCYFPWWLGQDQNRPPGTFEREKLREETGLTDEEIGTGTPLLAPRDYANIPADAQRLVRHWVAGENDGPETMIDQALVEMDTGRDLRVASQGMSKL